MAASFTISEFSELVSAALDGRSDYRLEVPGGGDGDPTARARRIHLRNTPPDTPQHTSKKTDQFHRNGTQGLAADSTSLFAFTSNSRAHPNNPYNNYRNPAAKMLIISPPGPGPLPPSITPILSASMSTVDLGANCLSLSMAHAGCGGTVSKSALEASEPLTEHAMPSVSASATLTNSSPSNPSTPRHRPLALLAKIKRQLSKSNVDSGVIYTPENISPAEPSLTPPQDKTGGRALAVSSSTTVPSNPAVSFAPTPSFYPPSFDAVISEDSSVAMFPSNDISAPKRRLRRGSSESLLSLSESMTGGSYSYDYGCSDSAFSAYSAESARVAGSLTSYIDVAEPSFIGSSRSFFAALNRGRDGRTGRRGSESEEEPEIREQAGFDGEFGFPDATPDAEEYCDARRRYSAQTLTGSEDGRQGSYASAPRSIHDGEAETQSIQSYMPYLPLAMQLERNQQGLKTRVSVEDVASLVHSRSSLNSRASIAASTSSPSAERQSIGANSVEMMGLTPVIKPRPRSSPDKYSSPDGKSRRRIPPPLRPTPSRSSVGSHPYATAAALQQPYSPASSASSRSPITPCTPFFTASEASLEGEEEDDNESRITSSAEAAGRMEEHAMNKALGKHISSDTFGQPRLPPSLSNDASARVRVHVLPPTPTILDLVPQYTNITDRDGKEAPSATKFNSDTGNSTDDGVMYQRNHNISKSRASRQSYISIKVPPMSPPPSGPLPLPPLASPSSGNERAKTLSAAHHRSLSPQTSLEWLPHRHPSPLTRPLSHETQFWDEDELQTSDGSKDASPIASTGGTQDSPIHHDVGSVLHQSSEGLSGMESTTDTSDFASFVSDSSSTHTSQTQERTLAAILAENTRANAFDGFFHPSKAEKIGVGRRQVPRRRSSTKADTQGEAEGDREWTLGLGMPPSPVPAMLFPSVSVDPTLIGGSSPVRKRVQLASEATPARRSVIPRAAEHATLRDRTMSESALGKSAKARKSQMVNEDWTLSLPLPGHPTRGPTPNKNVVAVLENIKTPVIIIVPETDCSSVQDSALDVESTDQDELDSVLDLMPRDSTAPMEVEQVDILVPRVVTTGSGIERASRSRSTSTRRQPTVFESEEDEGEPDVFGATDTLANENLAKLDALSADLARFNELLRQGGAQLRRGNEGSASLLVPPIGRGLKHARSCGVLEVDEPPPKNAILRTASFGNLLVAEDTAREKPTDDTALGPSILPPTPVFAFHAPLDDNSPTLPKPDMHQFVADALRPASSERPSSSSSSQSVALTASMSTISARSRGASFNSKRSSAGSTSSTVTARAGTLRSRASLPLASPPSAFAYKPAGLHLDDTVTVEVDPTVRKGLASGSALGAKRSRSMLVAGRTADSETTLTVEGKPVPSPEDLCSRDDTASHSRHSTREAPSRSDLPQTIDSTLSSSATSSITTPTKPNLPSLTITTTPSSSPKRPSGGRRMSISSISSEDSAGSSSSLTPTLSPAYDSSADPTPLASYFPAPPASHPLASLFGDPQRARLASVSMSKNRTETAVRTPEKQHALSAVSLSPKAMVPTLEDRIQRLRKLGMDAVTVRERSTSVNSSPTSVKVEKECANENEQVDTDSDAVYYSARSSFSSAR